MVKENEKKFLLQEDGITHVTAKFYEMYRSVDECALDVLNHGREIRQGYLPLKEGIILGMALGFDNSFPPIEARLRDDNQNYFLTLKGDGSEQRDEFEKPLQVNKFNMYWNATQGKRVFKRRLDKEYGIYVVEFEVYTDRKLGIAEIEVKYPAQLEGIPILGKDVTKDKNYKNRNLAK